MFLLCNAHLLSDKQSGASLGDTLRQIYEPAPEAGSYATFNADGLQTDPMHGAREIFRRQRRRFVQVFRLRRWRRRFFNHAPEPLPA